MITCSLSWKINWQHYNSFFSYNLHMYYNIFLFWILKIVLKCLWVMLIKLSASEIDFILKNLNGQILNFKHVIDRLEDIWTFQKRYIFNSTNRVLEVQNLINQMLENEINLRLAKFYKHQPASLPSWLCMVLMKYNALFDICMHWVCSWIGHCYSLKHVHISDTHS